MAHRLLSRGPATQADLVARSGLSRPTVTHALGRLSDAGLVEIAGEVEANGSGRRAQLYQLTPRAGLAVGVEIGWRHVTATVVDAGHKQIYRHEEPLVAGAVEHPAEVLRQAAKVAVKAAESRRGAGPLLGFGIGLTGQVAFHDDF